MNIPTKLQLPEIKFVLLERGGKKPFEKGWQNKHIKFNDSVLLSHQGNYGVMGGGKKNLVIVDFDDADVQEEVLEKLPKTFTVKTGSGLLHKYFFSDRSESFKIFNENMDTLADIQGDGKQVVGAGSIHPNGNEYELVEDEEIATIDYAELKAIMMAYDKKPRKIIEKTPPRGITGDFLDEVKRSISLSSLLDDFGVNTSKNPTNCPFHSSKGGKCLGFNDETWHCFHCEESGNIFSLVMKVNNCDFKEALEFLVEKVGLEEELAESRRKWKQENSLNKLGGISLTTLQQEVATALVLKDENKASELIVEDIKSKHHIYTTIDDVKSEIWFYKDGIYIPNGKSRIQEITRKILGETYTAQRVNRIIVKIEADTQIEHDDFFRNEAINEIPVMNGILDIFTRELKDFTPTKIFFNKLPIIYDEKVSCPNVKQFFADVLKEGEDVKVMMELIGFCLLKEYRFEKSAMFVGDGRNGKSKTLSLLKHFLGPENCCSIPLSQLTPASTSVWELHGRLANLAGDLSNTDLKDTGMFKQVTGRDFITAKRKYLNDLFFENYAKIIFACNELPKVYDLSDGFWSRWILFEFPYKFCKMDEYNAMEDKSHAKIMDEDIIVKITTPQELSGLLNEALDGLDRLIRNKGFSYSKGTKDVKDLWIRKSDSFAAFCIDNLEEGYECRITKKKLRREYNKYCKALRLPGCSDKAIKATLQDRYGAVETRPDFGGDRDWEGIKFRGEKEHFEEPNQGNQGFLKNIGK